jgi:hypothetical protein
VSCRVYLIVVNAASMSRITCEILVVIVYCNLQISALRTNLSPKNLLVKESGVGCTEKIAFHIIR